MPKGKGYVTGRSGKTTVRTNAKAGNRVRRGNAKVMRKRAQPGK